MKKTLVCILTLIISTFSLYGMEQKDVTNAVAEALASDQPLKAFELLDAMKNTVRPFKKITNANWSIFEKALDEGYRQIVVLIIRRYGKQLSSDEINDVKVNEIYKYADVKSAIADWETLYGKKQIIGQDINDQVADLLGGNQIAQIEAAQLIMTGNVDPNFKYKNTTIFEAALTDNPIIMTALINRFGGQLNQQQIDKVKNANIYLIPSSLQATVAAWETQYGKKEVSVDRTDELYLLVTQNKDEAAKQILGDTKSKINFGDRDLLPLIASTGDLDMVKLFLQKGKGQIPAAIIERALNYTKNNKLVIEALNAALGKPTKELTFQEVKDSLTERLENKNIAGALNLFKHFDKNIIKNPEYAPVWSGAAFAASQLDPNIPNGFLGTQNEQIELVGLLIDAAGKNFNEKLIDPEHKATIIHWAVGRANFPLLQAIISKLSGLISQNRLKALINQQDKEGLVPLLVDARSYAFEKDKKIESAYENIFELLIRNGAQDLALEGPNGQLLEKPSEAMERARIKKQVEDKNKPIVIIPPVGKGLDGALNALSQTLHRLAQAL